MCAGQERIVIIRALRHQFLALRHLHISRKIWRSSWVCSGVIARAVVDGIAGQMLLSYLVLLCYYLIG